MMSKPRETKGQGAAADERAHILAALQSKIDQAGPDSYKAYAYGAAAAFIKSLPPVRVAER